MDWLYYLIDIAVESDYLKEVFGPELVRYLFMVSIVVSVVIRTVGKHFNDMRDELKNVRLEIHDFKDIFRAENRSMKKQTQEVEARVESLDYRVYALETQISKEA
jgi:hypothetical protein